MKGEFYGIWIACNELVCMQETEEHKMKATQLESELSDANSTIKYKVHDLEKQKQQLFKKVVELKHDDKQSERILYLGNGRYGKTNKAIVKNKLCAMKILHIKLLEHGRSVAKLVAEFKSKCLACFGIDHHNLVKLIDISEVDNQVAIVTELMQLDLCTYITLSGGSLSLDVQVSLSIDMSQGLEALHSHSLIHGHLHDHNILIQGDQAKISDYYYPLLGLGEYCSEDHEITRVLPYMAPEVVHCKSCFSSDIFSLGPLIFQVVTGSSPTEESKTALTGISKDHVLLSLIQQCFNGSVEGRPSITKLCKEIKNAQKPQMSS